MISETQKWIDEKIKAGYDTGKIKSVLVKNGLDENEAISMIKEAMMQKFRKDAPAKTQERKTYSVKTVAAAIGAIMILIISIITVTGSGSEKCDILARGDERHYCDAVDTDMDIEENIRSCLKIDDEKLAAACIDRAVQKSDKEIAEDVCNIESANLISVCLAAIERAEARENKKAMTGIYCEEINDSDIKTWCIAKSLEMSALTDSILKCREIKDPDYRYLCRADKYRVLGDIEEEEMCQMIGNRLYRFVCLN